MQKWEYEVMKVIEYHYDDMEDRLKQKKESIDELNEMGNKGWELVSTLSKVYTYKNIDKDGTQYIHFFKRPLND